jgi:F0F1-type ATP synthase assembly protein I
MRASRLVIAIVLALVGAVWVGQGLGYIGGSFMTGSQFWATIGTLCLVVAAAVVILEARRSRAKR